MVLQSVLYSPGSTWNVGDRLYCFPLSSMIIIQHLCKTDCVLYICVCTCILLQCHVYIYFCTKFSNSTCVSIFTCFLHFHLCLWGYFLSLEAAVLVCLSGTLECVGRVG